MDTQRLPSFGPYRVSARLAVGGMAEVYLARREEPGAPPGAGALGPAVALKRLLPHLLGDPGVVRMFVNEARITARIDHPNVVRILEVGDHRGQPFIAMELLDGNTFAQLREKAAERGERVPLPLALRILVEACRGLDAAHRAKDDQGQPLCIVHRDFTPDNIHVGAAGGVKVLDFGIAKSTHTPTGTEPGTLKGKYFYMSPEMISGDAMDHRADVFAAGVMLYEQLCGHRPFTGTTPVQILAKISQEAPRRPTTLDPSVPLQLERICLRALCRHPEGRFATLADLADALAAVPEAPPAQAPELARYMAERFPEDTDTRRLLVAAATPTPSPRPALAPPPSGPKAGAPARSISRKLLRWLPLPLLLIGAGAGGWYWMHRPLPAPAARLAKAQSEPSPRARLPLATLGEDPRATPAQLDEAGRLLLAVHADRAALALAEDFERAHPQEPAAFLMEARATIGLRYGKRAEAALDRAAALAPSDPRPDEARADLRALQGDLPGALEAIEAATRKAPHRTRLVIRHADLLVRLGKLAEAEAVTAAAMGGGFSPQLAAERAFVELQLGHRKEATALLHRVLRVRPKLAAAHYYLGAALGQQDDTAGAEREYRQADTLDPEDTRALEALITLLGQSHREAEAAEAKKMLAARTAETD